MGYTLLEKPNPYKKQYRYPRRSKPSGVVVIHSAENVPDMRPPDTGAEGVASYISRRRDAGSYHVIADSDSLVYVLPPDYEAWQDGTGTNSHAYAVSVATRAAGWKDTPDWWRDAAVKNMAKAAAEYAQWIKKTHGVTIPARRISRDESTNGVPGFISHAERDPGRRSDPGADFNWTLFFQEYSRLVGTSTSTEEEDDQMYVELILAAYHAKRGKTYDPRSSDPTGWVHWMEQLAINPDKMSVVKECRRLLNQFG